MGADSSPLNPIIYTVMQERVPVEMMQGLAHPEPTSLGDSLVEMERFLLDTVLAVAEKGESPVPNPAPGSGSGRLARLVIGLCVARDRVGSGRHWRLPP